MNVVDVYQPFLEKYNDVTTWVYVKDYVDQRAVNEWCKDNFGDYRLSYSRPELDEPVCTTVYIFKNPEQAMMFRLRFEGMTDG